MSYPFRLHPPTRDGSEAETRLLAEDESPAEIRFSAVVADAVDTPIGRRRARPSHQMGGFLRDLVKSRANTVPCLGNLRQPDVVAGL